MSVRNRISERWSSEKIRKPPGPAATEAGSPGPPAAVGVEREGWESDDGDGAAVVVPAEGTSVPDSGTSEADPAAPSVDAFEAGSFVPSGVGSARAGAARAAETKRVKNDESVFTQETSWPMPCHGSRTMSTIMNTTSGSNVPRRATHGPRYAAVERSRRSAGERASTRGKRSRRDKKTLATWFGSETSEAGTAPSAEVWRLAGTLGLRPRRESSR